MSRLSEEEVGATGISWLYNPLNLFDIPQIILKFAERIGKTIHQGKLPKLIIENRNIERINLWHNFKLRMA